MDKRFAVAIVIKPHGIRGEVKLKILGDNPSSLLDLKKVLFAEDAKDAMNITKSWQYKDTVCMAIEGIDSREKAEELRGKYLYTDMKNVKPLNEGSYYIKDLIGCTLQDEKGENLGEIRDILQHGAADIYVVKGDKNFMMPALKKVIINFNLEAKKITVKGETLSEVAVYEN